MTKSTKKDRKTVFYLFRDKKGLSSSFISKGKPKLLEGGDQFVITQPIIDVFSVYSSLNIPCGYCYRIVLNEKTRVKQFRKHSLKKYLGFK